MKKWVPKSWVKQLIVVFLTGPEFVSKQTKAICSMTDKIAK
jgi:hypothetical protein